MTRVMWTPPLRESFSFPFLIVQMVFLALMLKYSIMSPYDIIDGIQWRGWGDEGLASGGICTLHFPVHAAVAIRTVCPLYPGMYYISSFLLNYIESTC